MSEYVIEIPDYAPPFDPFARAASLGEEIIRCRDCKLRVKKGSRLYCDLNAGGFPEVEPDGFCAWGERIVRCKDCVSSYRDEDGMWCCFHGTGFYRKPTDESDYCSKGKRRDA